MTDYPVTATTAAVDLAGAGTMCQRRVSAACIALALIAATTSHVVARGPLQNFVTHEAPKTIAVLNFTDEQGRSRSSAEFEGKVVVLNIWATWCVPCRREMPALDRLQGTLGGPDLTVVPISIDRGGLETVTKFYAGIGIRYLPKYIDGSGQAVRVLAAMGLPTTLILDRAGQEVARVVGPTEWDSPDVAEYLKSIVSRQSDRIISAERDDDHGRPAPSGAAGPLTRALRWLKTFVVN
jgi:thiol-disulfide isomerase/thioredoxin